LLSSSATIEDFDVNRFFRSLTLSFLLAPRSVLAEEGKPFRVAEAVGSLPTFDFGLEHRARYEHLANDFRSTSTGNASGLFLRTLLHAELRLSPVVVGAELQDARAYVLDETPVNTSTTNPLELLRAYVGLRLKDALMDGDTLSATLGRMTLDLQRIPMPPSPTERATRRLLARNDFRNTINGFNGLDVHWLSPNEHFVRFLAAFPVGRLPSEPEELLANDIVFDRENTHTILWSAFYSSPPVLSGAHVEGYIVGLHESDATDTETANRRLLTPGARFFRAPKAGQVDFMLEAMLQVGTSRASNKPEDTTDLDHLAFSGAASLGYQIAHAWKPRVVAQYDFASGDADPTDDANQRFDTLFGARRFDFGPTGLYGALARTNLHSPGVRFEAAPHRMVDGFVAYRWNWLASAKDAWTSATLRDTTGESGSFIGSQIEGRLRFSPFPRNLSFETGAAYFLRGDFARDAEGGRSAPATYVYGQITGWL
jgi:hypothetical protein